MTKTTTDAAYDYAATTDAALHAAEVADDLVGDRGF